MEVFNYIKQRRSKGPLHFTLIDPDKQKAEDAGKLAKLAKDSGTDAIMVGGTHATHLFYLDETVKNIKDSTDLPVILFPSSHSGLSPNADALFFMSLLNSRSTQYLIEEQMKGSIFVKKYGLEPLSMAYLIVESGSVTSAAFSGDVKAIPREKPEFAAAYSLAAKYLGMKFVYLEAGSGADSPVPNDMVSVVKKAIGEDMFLIVGGGIRDEGAAREKIKAGADIIVTGTIAENDSDKFRNIIKAVKSRC